MTSDSLREARAACERALAFLETDFGYRRCRRRFQWNGFELGYCGQVFGVLVTWYPRDPLTVWLVKLVDDDLPRRPTKIDRDTPLHYFDLGDLEFISAKPREANEREMYGMPTEENALILASSLRACGGDLLNGDLALLPALEQRIKDRTRADAVARWGAQGAREMGW